MMMRILINDHAGHPFQVQLSRSLALRGHQVLHTFTGDLQTPRGALQRRVEDPPHFQIEPVYLARPFERYGMVRRFMQEKELGRHLQSIVQRIKPDVVISANTPIGAQKILLKACKNINADFYFWLQDVLGVGIKNNVSKKLPFAGSLIGNHYIRLENKILRNSNGVIAITEDFSPVLRNAGVCEKNIHVIHNWAPLEEMPVREKRNTWAIEHDLDTNFNFIYSGTLGMKHNPELLVLLAKAFKNEACVRIVVISEGLGAEYLEKQKKEQDLDNLTLLPFQSFESLPDVLAASDVLITLLEPDAGVFAVPSKVLTSLCTRRPLLLAVPEENLASRIVSRNQTGLTCLPSDTQGFIDAALKLYRDSALRERLAGSGRQYAEKTFDIKTITDQFEEILVNTR